MNSPSEYMADMMTEGATISEAHKATCEIYGISGSRERYNLRQNGKIMYERRMQRIRESMAEQAMNGMKSLMLLRQDWRVAGE